MIHIPTKKLADFEKNIRREWTMTNGIGGYAGGSIIGACNRTHQGYLIASLHPPVERYLVFSKTNEKLTQGTHVYNLETSQHAGKGHSPIRTQGQRFLTVSPVTELSAFPIPPAISVWTNIWPCCGNQTQLRSPIRLQTRERKPDFPSPRL